VVEGKYYGWFAEPALRASIADMLRTALATASCAFSAAGTCAGIRAVAADWPVGGAEACAVDLPAGVDDLADDEERLVLDMVETTWVLAATASLHHELFIYVLCNTNNRNYITMM
jgi:hypothetical protein